MLSLCNMEEAGRCRINVLLDGLAPESGGHRVCVREPQLRLAGAPGEQWTMFFYDPFGNPLQIKGFASL